MKKIDGLAIYVPKVKGRQHPFWYEHRSPIATYKGFDLSVTCESVIREKHTTWKVELTDVAKAAKDDKGLRRLVGNEGRLKRNQEWWWDDTTSFEVFTDAGDSCGEVFTYDEGIKLLVRLGKENSL
jgi:hypothetical protein